MQILNLPSNKDSKLPLILIYCVEDTLNIVDVDDRHTDGGAWSDVVNRGTIGGDNVPSSDLTWSNMVTIGTIVGGNV